MLDVVVWLCLFLDETGYTIGVRLDEKPMVLPERASDVMDGFEPKRDHELRGRGGSSIERIAIASLSTRILSCPFVRYI